MKNIENPFEYILHKGKRHKRSLVFTTLPNKIRIEVPASIYILFKEIFMSDVYAIDELVKKIPSKPVIVDIGANVGFFDILILSKLPEAKIYAYEPVEANVANVKKIMKDNPSVQQAVSIYPYAVTGKPSEALELFMEDTSNSQVVASVYPDFNANNTKKIRVPCITLTDIIEQHQLQQIDILKIDCEGSEYEILYNTKPDIIRKARIICLEIHNLDKETKNYAAMTAFLSGLGYTFTSDPINDFCYAVEAIRN